MRSKGSQSCFLKITRPLEKIISDMTVIAHRGIRYEWTYFLDVYNNSIIA